MTGGGTRRAFLGAGLAAAAGAGLTRLPGALSTEAAHTKQTLALDARGLSSASAHPTFGTLLPRGGSQASLQGVLHERGSERVAGSLSITSIPTEAGMLRIHSLDLQKGSIVAIGHDGDTAFAVRSGSGRYADARGSITVKGAAHAALALDIELEL